MKLVAVEWPNSGAVHQHERADHRVPLRDRGAAEGLDLHERRVAERRLVHPARPGVHHAAGLLVQPLVRPATHRAASHTPKNQVSQGRGSHPGPSQPGLRRPEARPRLRLLRDREECVFVALFPAAVPGCWHLGGSLFFLDVLGTKISDTEENQQTDLHQHQTRQDHELPLKFGSAYLRRKLFSID